jgi:hypothetical protein
MRKILFTLISGLAFTSLPVLAAPLVSVTSGADSATFVPGQSVTTPVGGPFDNILFNWYNSTGAPTAAGSLFALTQSYTGTPAALSAATPGFLASTSTINSGVYVFTPGVTLQGNTQYFFYATVPILNQGAAIGTYPGGNLYAANDTTVSFSNVAGQDANFTLSGTTAGVPEPSSLLLFGAGLLAVAFFRQR